MLHSAATDFRHDEGTCRKKSICMVVSLLIVLMQDQSASFTTRGISAGCVRDKDKIKTLDKTVGFVVRCVT